MVVDKVVWTKEQEVQDFNKSGDTATIHGNFKYNATSDMGATDTDLASKKYVDDNIGGGGVEPLWISGATLYPARADQAISGAGFYSIGNVSGANIVILQTHIDGDGSDHADVATNTGNISTNVTAIGLNTTHKGSNGSDHSKVTDNETEILAVSAATLVNTAELVEVSAATIINIADILTVSQATLVIPSISGATIINAADILTVSAATLHITNISAATLVNASEIAEVSAASLLNTAHRNDNTQAHTDYLKNDAADVGVSLTLTGDQVASAANYVPMVVFDTFDTPLAAGTYPKGTIYIQYTA